MSDSFVPAELTTQFVPPATCMSIFHDTSSNYISLGRPEPDYVSSCFPSGWDSTSNYLSGTTCIVGYTLYDSITKNGVTFGTCCPEIFLPTVIFPGDIVEFSGIGCKLSFRGSIGIALQTVTVFETDVSNQAGYTTITWKGGDAINAYAMTLGWTAPSTSMTTTTSSAPVVASATSTSDVTTTTTTTIPTSVAISEGLHGGGMAGVIIGALIASAVVVELIVWYLLRRRQSISTGQYDKSDGLYGIIGIVTRLVTRHGRQAAADKGRNESVGEPVYMAPDNNIYEMAERDYNDIHELGAEPAGSAPYRDDPDRTPR